MSLHPQLKPLTAETLLQCVKIFETHCPGWWWSISQYPGRVCFTLGPGRNCPHKPDITYALTKEGDSGSSDDFSYNLETGSRLTIFEETQAVRSLRYLISSFNDVRGITGQPSDSIVIPSTPTYRFQNSEALESLKGQYSFLVNRSSILDSEDFVLENIYLGSCDLTADCSLRGKTKSGEEFDFSCDLPDNFTIAESVLVAHAEFLSKILQ